MRRVCVFCGSQSGRREIYAEAARHLGRLLAERQLGLVFDGAFANTAQTYRTLGTLIGEAARAEELAAYAERTLGELRARLAAIPASQRPRVYYGRGPRGLETGLAGSINLEVLEQVGAVNVAAELGRGGLANVSLEQVLGWNPDVILTLDGTFYRAVGRDSLWQPIKAVRERRVYLAPAAPWGWIDAPPGVNRLIGIRWLTAVLYPDAFPGDLRAITRDFYARFYHVQIDDAQLDALLRPATSLAQ